MKELYQNAEMDVVVFEAEDIVTTSNSLLESMFPGMYTTWSKRPNETEPDYNTGW